MHFEVQFALFFLITVCRWQECELTSAPSIRAAAILFRHESRAPVVIYKKDSYINYKWPGGLGALLPKGIKEAYKSGLLKKNRFGSLLTKNDGLYSTENIQINSSAIQRCLLTTESFMAGLYPPPTDLNLLPIRWQPVAILSSPEKQDYLLAQGRPCPKYDLTLWESLTLNNSNVDALLGGNTDFFEYLKNNTGEEITSLISILLIADTLKVEQDNGLELPSWAKPVYKDILEPLARLAYYQFGQAAVTKIKGGALLNYILDKLNKFKKGSTQNVFVYGAHDSTVLSLLVALNVENQTTSKPNYGATVTTELHENKEIDDLEIRFYYYRNSTDVEPIKIDLKKCPAPCSLKKFNRIIKPVLVPDYDKKCNDGKKYYNNYNSDIFWNILT